MRRGTDYNTINVRTRAKVAFTSVIKFHVDMKSDLFQNSPGMSMPAKLILGRGLKQSDI